MAQVCENFPVWLFFSQLTRVEQNSIDCSSEPTQCLKTVSPLCSIRSVHVAKSNKINRNNQVHITNLCRNHNANAKPMQARPASIQNQSSINHPVCTRHHAGYDPGYDPGYHQGCLSRGSTHICLRDYAQDTTQDIIHNTTQETTHRIIIPPKIRPGVQPRIPFRILLGGIVGGVLGEILPGRYPGWSFRE